MERDLKVGLMVGVALVAVVAVVFFRRDEQQQNRFRKLIPAAESVAGRARNLLGTSRSAPYRVGPEYLSGSWVGGRRPSGPGQGSGASPRGRRSSGAAGTRLLRSRQRSNGPAAVLQRPRFMLPSNAGSRKPARGERRPPTAAVAPKPAAAADRVYVVQENDTLMGIARRIYGNEQSYWQIFEANRDLLQSPDDLKVGLVLRLPR